MPEKILRLAGLRVLIVEDSWLVAEALADTLRDWGCHVVGPAGGLEEGLVEARDAALDGALLDINLGAVTSLPIALVLRARAVPFLFLTGYDAPPAFPPELAGVQRLTKPVDPRLLAGAIASAFQPLDVPGR